MSEQEPNTETEKLIRAEEIRMLYAAIPFSSMAAIVVSIIYLVILYDHVESQRNLQVWFAVMVAITLLRAWDTRQYNKASTDSKARISHWKMRFLLGSVLAGAWWGMLIWLGYTPVKEYQALIVVGIVGVTGGAMSTQSYYRHAITLFLVSALGLMELFLIIEETEFSKVTSYLLAFYMLFTLFTSKRIYQNSSANIRLRMEADVRERTLMKTKEAAEQASQAKSEFLSHMSHELRTPLNAIIGFTQLLEYDNQLNARQRSQIQEISQAGSHLLSLVNRILDLTSIEEGSLQLNIQPVSVNALFTECQSLTRSLAEKHLVTITGELEEHYTADADYTALKQILLNLLSNAIKYNKAGGSVFVTCGKQNTERIRISVRDTGAGLSVEQIEYIFEPFNRLNSVGNKIEGTGIGLSITRDLVKHMGGEMGVEGRVGHGSLFWVELPGRAEPLKAITANATPAEREQQSSAPVTGEPDSKPRILIAEDNPANQLLLAKQLRLFGYECDQANNGKQALELFKQNNYALILTDCNMPIMDGYQFSLAIRATNNKIPIIAITADAFPDNEDRCATVGMNDRLIKPVQLYALKALLAKWLGYRG